MENRIYVKPRFRKLNGNEYQSFWQSLHDARLINEHGTFVLLRDLDVYKESLNFLIGHGIAGFAIHNDEMISVHKNNLKANETNVKHILPKMVRCAFKHGAKYLDCYGDFLANYYMSSGFIAIAKVPFDNIEDNPPNWDVKKHGKPFCYILVKGVRNIAELDRLQKQNELASFDSVKPYLKTIKNLDLAEQYRNELYNKLKIYGYKKRIEIIKNL